MSEVKVMTATGLVPAFQTQGPNGKTLLSGTVPPSSGDGVDGDYYINKTANTIYGPKTAGAWGSPTSMIGPPSPVYLFNTFI